MVQHALMYQRYVASAENPISLVKQGHTNETKVIIDKLLSSKMMRILITIHVPLVL